MAKEAYVFLFTDWHLHRGNSGRQLQRWPPFAQNEPPDARTIAQIAQEINRRLDGILAGDFPPEEKILFRHSDCGLEVIGSDAEPKWKDVWGAIMDRSAVTPGDNSEKLRKMARGLAKSTAKSNGVRKHRATLFFTPESGGRTPEPAKEYKLFIDMYNAGDPSELVFCIAGWLAHTAQHVESSEILGYFEREY